MVTWKEFADEAPQVAQVFIRRHAATGNLCLLATLRSDGYPRISPIEPRIVEDHLVIVGMPNTTKFRDLGRDPRFSLHTATVDPYVGDGDAKLWGDARNLQDHDLHERFAADLFEQAGAGSPRAGVRSLLCGRFDRCLIGDLRRWPVDDHHLEAR